MVDRIDAQRSKQKGRGRRVSAPAQLGKAGWKDAAARVLAKIGSDRVLLVAAGVTFYALLSLIPALSALVSLYGLVFDATDVAAQATSLAGIVPAGGLAIIEEQLTRLSSEGPPQLGWALTISVGLGLWSASAGVKALFQAMNVVNGEEEKRGFVLVNAIALLLTLAGILGAAMALTIVLVLPAVLDTLGWEGGWLIQVVGYVLLAALLFGSILVLYRFGPSRRRAQWQWAVPGAAFSIVAIIAFSVGFSWYAATFASFENTYGSLGALVGMLTWMWLSVAVIIIGAEINAEAEHQTAVDTTESPDLPLGRRGARMADTVGASRAEGN